MRTGVPWLIAAAVILLIVAVGAGIRLAVTADPARRARAREAAAAVAQYGLLFGFAAVAAAISAHGLVGFARSNMGLPGPWPYLLWGALDGAAGLCAVLLMRRAARGESAMAPRLAVWGLVAASSLFNWTHAPGHPGAREAFALMPVIAATLFEFSLRETRHTAGRTDRRLTGLRWLRPAERIRVQLQLAADETLPAEAATRRVRVDTAARRLHLLRRTLGAPDRAAGQGAVVSFRVRRAERRAQVALTRARFADPGAAAEVLRQVQVLTLTRTLAGLDYATPDAAQAALASLITPGPVPVLLGDSKTSSVVPFRRAGSAIADKTRNGSPARPGLNGALASALMTPNGVVGHAASGNGRSTHSVGFPALGPYADQRRPGAGGSPLVDAAVRIVSQARHQGVRISQADLARQLRTEGYSIANDRLRWLATVSGLEPWWEQR
jgi:hypothetical protein